MTVFKREIKKRRQHLHRQFDGNKLHPVKGFAFRQTVEQFARAFAHKVFEAVNGGWRGDGLHGLALRRVARLIHGNEVFQLEIIVWIVLDGVVKHKAYSQ